jgi:hypothetical protein
VKAIKGNLKRRDKLELEPTVFCRADMALVHRGRLSVQRVQTEAWNVIEKMAEKGGWNEEEVLKGKGRRKREGEVVRSQKKRKVAS